LARSDAATQGARARALTAAGGLLRELGEFDAAVRHLDEAVAIDRALHDTAGLVTALSQLAAVWMYRGEFALARPLLEEGIELARQSGDRFGEAFHLGTLAFIDADLPRLEQSLALRRSVGEPRGIAMALGHIGNTALLAGDYAHADSAMREGLALARELGDRWTIVFLIEICGYVALALGDAAVARESFVEAIALDRGLRGSSPVYSLGRVEGLAGVAFLSGVPDRAARLFGAAETLREQRQPLGVSPVERARTPLLDGMRARLRADDLRQAWLAGRALSPDEALALALAPLPAPAGAPTGGLSNRELEVVRLLVEGHSNQEIAAALFISPHTAINHVANIMNKLGLESRTAVASWAIRNGLA
jgi:DNA-binding CsgD family transcriptional regulator/tetratricopeptide (TPR) repeat protein